MCIHPHFWGELQTPMLVCLFRQELGMFRAPIGMSRSTMKSHLGYWNTFHVLWYQATPKSIPIAPIVETQLYA